MAGLLSYLWGSSGAEDTDSSKPRVKITVTLDGEAHETVLGFAQSLEVEPPIDVYKSEDAATIPAKKGQTVSIEVEGRPAKDVKLSSGQQTLNFATEAEQLAEVSFVLGSGGLTVSKFQLQLRGEDDGKEAAVAAAAAAAAPEEEEKPAEAAEAAETKSKGKKKKKKKKGSNKAAASTEGKVEPAGELSEEMVAEYTEADKDCSQMEAQLVQQMLELTMNPTENKEEQESQLSQRLVMVRSMKKNLLSCREKAEELTDDLKNRIRQLAVRDVMQLQLDQLEALKDPAAAQRITMVKQSIANFDQMLAQTPQQMAARMWGEWTAGNANGLMQMQQQLSQIEKTEVDAKQEEMKARAIRSINHRVFVTQLVVDKLKAYDMSTLTGPTDATDAKNQILKASVKARIDWLEQNDPEDEESIQGLTARYEEMEKGNFEPHNHAGGGHGQHGHSHNGVPCGGHGPPPQQHGHSHNGKPCHGHGPRRVPQQQHGHSHNGVPCGGHGPAPSHGHSHAQPQQHGHSHNGVPCGGHGPAPGSSHGHSHAGGDHGHSHAGGDHGHEH